MGEHITSTLRQNVRDPHAYNLLRISYHEQ